MSKAFNERRQLTVVSDKHGTSSPDQRHERRRNGDLTGLVDDRDVEVEVTEHVSFDSNADARRADDVRITRRAVSRCRRCCAKSNDGNSASAICPVVRTPWS